MGKVGDPINEKRGEAEDNEDQEKPAANRWSLGAWRRLVESKVLEVERRHRGNTPRFEVNPIERVGCGQEAREFEEGGGCIRPRFKTGVGS
jgi:hypothetical protein